MSTLYRQYRPQTFAEVVGQNHVKITLAEEIKRHQIASAYLFCGPRAVGKTTIARLLAKSLNCLNRPEDTAEPCNNCANCLTIAAGQSLDIIEVDAASQTGVDNVRENIIASSHLAPSQGKYKVFIIDEVHMLSTSSFNALLKTLEEPPEQVIFILCTTEVHKIPATVVSRCERFDFKKISLADIIKKLSYILKQEGWSADEAVLGAIAKNSQGHLRDAESLLGQLMAVSQPMKNGDLHLTMEDFYLLAPSSDLVIISQFIKTLSEQNSVEAITIINKLVADGRDIRVFLQDLIEILRQLLLSKINPQLLAEYQGQWGEDDMFGLLELRQKLTINQLVQFLQLFIQAFNETREAFIIQLPVELAVVRAIGINELERVSKIDKPVSPSGLSDYDSSSLKKSVKKKDKQDETKEKKDEAVAPLLSQELLDLWPLVVNEIKNHNFGLSVVLKDCLPQIEGDQVCLVFGYKLHQDQIKQPSVKHLIEDIMAKVYGRQLTVTTRLLAKSKSNELISPENEVNNIEEGASLDNLLEIFNGQVVS